MAGIHALATATRDLLNASKPADVTIHDGEPISTPQGRYIVITDNAGTAIPDRLSSVGGSRDMRWLLTCMAVATTPDGVRRLTDWLRATLTDTPPTAGPSTAPLVEVGASDILTGGPEGDRRKSQTLIWAAHTDPRQEN